MGGSRGADSVADQAHGPASLPTSRSCCAEPALPLDGQVSLRSVVIVLAAAVVGFAAYTSRERLTPLHRSTDALRIMFAYSPNQEDLLVPLIRTFNHERHRLDSLFLGLAQRG